MVAICKRIVEKGTSQLCWELRHWHYEGWNCCRTCPLNFLRLVLTRSQKKGMKKLQKQELSTVLDTHLKHHWSIRQPWRREKSDKKLWLSTFMSIAITQCGLLQVVCIPDYQVSTPPGYCLVQYNGESFRIAVNGPDNCGVHISALRGSTVNI